MDVPHINPSYNPSNIPSNSSSLSQKMAKMIDHYRNLMVNYEKNPSLANSDKLFAYVYHMREFLETHRKEIFAEEKSHGWHKYSKKMNDGYEGIYNACMIGINTFLNPETRLDNPGNLEFVNEQITQLHWMLLHNHP